MYNKKGMIIPVLGTVLVVFSIVVASVIGLVIGPTFQGEAIQKGGLGISIHNHAEFWIKALDESIQIISRRSAYDLGKSGGVIGPEIFTWFIGYPTMDALQKNLESQIKEKLPQGTIKSGRIIEWGAGFIDVLYTDCGPIASSECFFVKGNKSFSISDKAIEAKISLNPHKFYFKIDSNYFRLLNAGRTILDVDPFKSIVFVDKDLGKLQREINNAKAAGDSRFKDLSVEITVSGDVVEFTISDKTCLLNNDNYCIAPLKPGENGIINPMSTSENKIPYDYLKLKFRVNVENAVLPPAPQKVTYTFKVVQGTGTLCVSSPDVLMKCTDNTKPNGMTITFDYDDLIKLQASPSSNFVKFVEKWKGTSVTLFEVSSPSPFKAEKDGAEIDAYFSYICLPATCSSLGKNCNSWSDGCGGIINCGTCPSDQQCNGGICSTAPRCPHTLCSQACDSLGIDFKWRLKQVGNVYVNEKETWTGTCPYGAEGCITGDCCIGQCDKDWNCFCERTNFVDVYSKVPGYESICPTGETCGQDCYCHSTTPPELVFKLLFNPASNSISLGGGSTSSEVKASIRLIDGGLDGTHMLWLELQSITTSTGATDPSNFGITVSFSPRNFISNEEYNWDPPSQSTTMTISTSSSTPANSYLITIKGTTATTPQLITTKTFTLTIPTSGTIRCHKPEDCDDLNPCTDNICRNAGTTSSTCENPFLPSGTLCGSFTGTCQDKCETLGSIGVEYRNGISTKTFNKVCNSNGNCISPTPTCFASDYKSINTCRYGCKDSVNCYTGWFCPSATAKCRWCLYGTCGDQSCTGGNQCYREGQIPEVLCTATCVCGICPLCWTGISKVVTTCSACAFANRETICSSSGCGSSYTSGCQLSSCYQTSTCTYE